MFETVMPDHWLRYGQRFFGRVLSTAATVFILAFVLNQSQEFSHCVHEGKQTQKYHDIQKSNGVFLQSLNAHWLRFRIYTGCAGHFTDKNEGALVAVATIALSIFTFTLWRSTNKLWETSERHAQHMARSVDAAIKTAEAAAQQADLMKTSQAARISVIAPHADLDIHEGQLWRIRAHLIIANNGGSETRNMMTTTALTIMSIKDQFVFDFPGDDMRFPTHSVPLGANSQIRVGESVIQSVPHLAAVVNSQANMFLYGWVEYDDIFTDTMRHRLEYCFKVSISNHPGGRWETTFNPYGPNNRQYDVPRPPPPTA